MEHAKGVSMEMKNRTCATTIDAHIFGWNENDLYGHSNQQRNDYRRIERPLNQGCAGNKRILNRPLRQRKVKRTLYVNKLPYNIVDWEFGAKEI